MWNRGLSLIVVALVALASHAETQHMARRAIRVIGINREYNVGVGAVDRAKTIATTTGGSVEPSQITEVCRVIEGKAALATGGTIENARESAPDTTMVKVLNGPSTPEGVVQNGTSRQVGPGGDVTIPPNTPHWSDETESPQIAYLEVRIGTHQAVPAGYEAK